MSFDAWPRALTTRQARHCAKPTRSARLWHRSALSACVSRRTNGTSSIGSQTGGVGEPARRARNGDRCASRAIVSGHTWIWLYRRWRTQTARRTRPRATGPRLVLRRAATDNSAAARVWQIQIFCPRVESERHALTNVQPAPRRRGKRVIECAVHGEHNGAATAVWRHIVLKERLVEQVDLPAVNLERASAHGSTVPRQRRVHDGQVRLSADLDRTAIRSGLVGDER